MLVECIRRKNLNCFVAFVLLISTFACSNSNERHTQRSTDEDSTSVSRENPDSISMAIFSEDYKLIKKIRYLKDSNWMIYESYIKGYPKSDTLVGDFEGNGQQDSAWFIRSETLENYLETHECNTSFVFSNKKIKPLELGNCCSGTFKNEGDLDGNGTDEIGVMCSAPASGCRYYYVYTYVKNQWGFFVDEIESSYSMREAGIVLIEKDIKNPGYVIVRNMLYYVNDSMPEEYRDQGGGCCAQSNVIEYRIKVSPLLKWNN